VKHEWFDPRSPRDPGRLSVEHRRCRNCAREQTLVVKTAWMRIVSRRWLPLVGRCRSKGAAPNT
jgi:hypothetical protein